MTNATITTVTAAQIEGTRKVLADFCDHLVAFVERDDDPDGVDYRANLTAGLGHLKASLRDVPDAIMREIAEAVLGLPAMGGKIARVFYFDRRIDLIFVDHIFIDDPKNLRTFADVWQSGLRAKLLAATH